MGRDDAMMRPGPSASTELNKEEKGLGSSGVKTLPTRALLWCCLDPHLGSGRAPRGALIASLIGCRSHGPGVVVL